MKRLRIAWRTSLSIMIAVHFTLAAHAPQMNQHMTKCGEPTNGLQMCLYLDGAAKEGEEQFRVDVRNIGKSALRLVLGLGGYPSGLTLTLIDLQGSHKLRLLDSAHPGVHWGDAGTIVSMFDVWLPQGSIYSIPIDLRSYDYFPSVNLPPGMYSLEVHLDVSAMYQANSPQTWIGTVRSNTVQVQRVRPIGILKP